MEFQFPEKQWLFVCITHTKARLGQSEIRLYVNSDLKGKAPLKYPSASNVRIETLYIDDLFSQFQLSQSRIGNNAELQTPNHRLYRETPFFGQMGGYIYMFDDALSSAQIVALFSFGPNFSILTANSSSNTPSSSINLTSTASSVVLNAITATVAATATASQSMSLALTSNASASPVSPAVVSATTISYSPQIIKSFNLIGNIFISYHCKVFLLLLYLRITNIKQACIGEKNCIDSTPEKIRETQFNAKMSNINVCLAR